MDHDVLQRKLTHLEEEILLAQSASIEGATLLPRISLTLSEAIRVAANIRNRLAGLTRPPSRQSYHVSRRS